MLEWIKKHWLATGGALGLLIPLWQFALWAIRTLGDIDFVVERFENPGWIGAVIAFLTDPPTWLFFPLLFLGLLFIWLDIRRRPTEKKCLKPTLPIRQTSAPIKTRQSQALVISNAADAIARREYLQDLRARLEAKIKVVSDRHEVVTRHLRRSDLSDNNWHRIRGLAPSQLEEAYSDLQSFSEKELSYAGTIADYSRFSKNPLQPVDGDSGIKDITRLGEYRRLFHQWQHAQEEIKKLRSNIESKLRDAEKAVLGFGAKL